MPFILTLCCYSNIKLLFIIKYLRFSLRLFTSISFCFRCFIFRLKYLQTIFLIFLFTTHCFVPFSFLLSLFSLLTFVYFCSESYKLCHFFPPISSFIKLITFHFPLSVAAFLSHNWKYRVFLQFFYNAFINIFC